MTLADLLAAVSADCGYEAIPSATVTARLTRYLGEGYRHLLSMTELGPLRSNTLSFRSIANEPLYGLPQTLVEIDNIVDQTNAIRLRLMTQDEFRTIDPQETSSGTPTHYVPWGSSPVQREPDHSQIWTASSSASDITQSVVIAAIRSPDDVDTSLATYTATLTGTTRIPLIAIPDVVSIQQFELSGPCIGRVELYDAAIGGQILATIQSGTKTVQYQQIRLWPTPAGVYTYAVDGMTSLVDILNYTSYDQNRLPDDFQLILADYARMCEYEYRDDSRLPMAQARYNAKLKNLRDRVMNPADYKPRVGRIRDRSSNLGSYFPPGRF